MDYYIWLPSNVESMPHNTKANYITRLFNRIRLHNLEYECAIVESFTPAFNKMASKLVLTKTEKHADGSLKTTEREHLFHSGELKQDGLAKINLALGQMAIDLGHVTAPPPVARTDKEKLAAVVQILDSKEGEHQAPNITRDLVQDAIDEKPLKEINNNIRIEQWDVGKTQGLYAIKGMPSEYHLQMYGDICSMFNFVPGQKLFNHSQSVLDDNPALPDSSMFYIYSDIVHQQYVGDSLVNLLGVIKVPYKQSHHNEFVNPTYIPINTDEIEWIRITIKDDSNSLIKFSNNGGKTLIKLHFRPRRYGF